MLRYDDTATRAYTTLERDDAIVELALVELADEGINIVADGTIEGPRCTKDTLEFAAPLVAAVELRADLLGVLRCVVLPVGHE